MASAPGTRVGRGCHTGVVSDVDDAGELAFFLQLEEGVWRALVAGDGEADGRLLSDDFLGVYPTGFASRTEHVRQLDDGPTVTEYSLSQARLITISEDGVLLCYRADCRRPSSPTTDPPDVMYISSLWCRREGEWVNVFSQDTPAATL